MIANLSKVTLILSGPDISGRQSLHAEAIGLILDEQLSQHDRVMELLSLYESNRRHAGEMYWAAVFEALFTGYCHGSMAEQTLNALAEEMGRRKDTCVHYLYPIVITALLKSANSVKKTAETAAFFAEAPIFVGLLMKDFAAGRTDTTEPPTGWLLGQFSTEFNAFLSPDTEEEAARRIQLFSLELAHVVPEEIAAIDLRFLSEVSGRLRTLMSEANMLIALADAFADGVKPIPAA